MLFYKMLKNFDSAIFVIISMRKFNVFVSQNRIIIRVTLII